MRKTLRVLFSVILLIGISEARRKRKALWGDSSDDSSSSYELQYSEEPDTKEIVSSERIKLTANEDGATIQTRKLSRSDSKSKSNEFQNGEHDLDSERSEESHANSHKEWKSHDHIDHSSESRKLTRKQNHRNKYRQNRVRGSYSRESRRSSFSASSSYENRRHDGAKQTISGSFNLFHNSTEKSKSPMEKMFKHFFPGRKSKKSKSKTRSGSRSHHHHADDWFKHWESQENLKRHPKLRRKTLTKDSKTVRNKTKSGDLEQKSKSTDAPSKIGGNFENYAVNNTSDNQSSSDSISGDSSGTNQSRNNGQIDLKQNHARNDSHFDQDIISNDYKADKITLIEKSSVSSQTNITTNHLHNPQPNSQMNSEFDAQDNGNRDPGQELMITKAANGNLEINPKFKPNYKTKL